MNVKPVWPVCVCVATMLQNNKKRKICWASFRILLIIFSWFPNKRRVLISGGALEH